MMSADSNVSDEESSVDMSNGEIATTLPAEKSCNDGVPISNSSNSPATTTTYQEIVEGDAKSLHKNNNEEPDLSNALDLEQAPSSTSAEPTPNDENNNIDPTLQKQSMELNVALESLESMRRLNIALEFGGSLQVQHDRCTYCQREALEKLKTNPPPPPPNPPQSSAPTKSGSGGINIGRVKLDGSRMRRFGSNVGSFFSQSSSSNNIDKMGDSNNSTSINCDEGSEVSNNNNNRASSSTSRRNILKKTHHPCLTCGHPTCSAHSSSNFSRNKIPMCIPCAYLFELDFLVDMSK